MVTHRPAAITGRYVSNMGSHIAGKRAPNPPYGARPAWVEYAVQSIGRKGVVTRYAESPQAHRTQWDGNAIMLKACKAISPAMYRTRSDLTLCRLSAYRERGLCG